MGDAGNEARLPDTRGGYTGAPGALCQTSRSGTSCLHQAKDLTVNPLDNVSAGETAGVETPQTLASLGF